MTEKEWRTSGAPDALLNHCWASASERKKRLFGCACCYRLDRFPDPRCKTAVRVAERFVDGESTAEALDTAYRSAGSVVRTHARRGRRGQYEDESQELFGGTAACSNVASPDPDHARWTWNDVANTRLEAGSKWHAELAATADLVRCVFGNPFRPPALDSNWLTSDVAALATGIYADRAFDRMPILADALQDAGCDNDDVLRHCRSSGAHGRGCWVIDALLGKA